MTAAHYTDVEAPAHAFDLWGYGAAAPEAFQSCAVAAAFSDPSAVVVAYEAGEDLFRAGDLANSVYRISKGTVVSYRLYADGRRQITGFSLPGDVIGLEAGVEYRAHAQALGPVTVRALKRRRLSVMAGDDSDLARDLWRLSLRAFRRSEDHVMILARQSAAERVANFLLDYADSVGADDVVDLPMSRQDIADYLGLTIHTVSRSLSQLEADGLISARSRRQVRLLRRDRLETLRE